MRIIVYGVGAIGGVIAASLAQAGQEVIGIARGAMLSAIRDKGLRLRAVASDTVVPLTCVAGPDEIAFRPDDAILLTMKTQDTEPALEALRRAGVTDQPIFCVQNGVENERLAARRFPNVHGVTVMMPATYLVPGEVAAFGAPRYGILDIGRFPLGVDAADEALAAQLIKANFGAFAIPDLIAGKYGKLLLNLRNIIQASVGAKAAASSEVSELADRVIAEGKAVLAAAGIEWRNVGADDPRRDQLMTPGEVTGASRTGGSTLQSLARGTGSLETDYLNGEIALLARLHGVSAPLNTGLCRVAAQLALSGAAPGAMTPEALRQKIEG